MGLEFSDARENRAGRRSENGAYEDPVTYIYQTLDGAIMARSYIASCNEL